MVDIITAGFPCQPHSVAGLRAGAHDGRNLWPYTLRAISDVGPRFVVLENVPGILANGYGGTVVGQLSEIGYDCRWAIVSAAEVGAPHRPQPLVVPCGESKPYAANADGRATGPTERMPTPRNEAV